MGAKTIATVAIGADSAGIRPRFTPNFQPLHDEKLAKTAQIHDEDPVSTGGEGVRNANCDSLALTYYPWGR